MAERRMFAKTIIDSDAFLDMPLSTQCLYFHLNMRADDEGFINNPKKIMRMIGASEDDFKVLITKRFVLTFESGVIVIKHWKIHNYIRNDRYKETVYQEEKSKLIEKENKAYSLGIPDDNQMTYQMDTQDRIGKDRIGKDRIDVVVMSDSCVDGSQNDSCVDGFDKVISFYNNNITLLTPYTKEILEDYSSELGNELVIYAMQKSVDANVRNINYIKGILNSWSNKGIKTLIQAKEEEQEFKNNKQKDNTNVLDNWLKKMEEKEKNNAI